MSALWILTIPVMLFVLLLLEMAIVVLWPSFPEPKVSLPDSGPGLKASSPGPSNRVDISFLADGVPIHGWLYLPYGKTEQIPCIVLNHGAGGTKDFALEQYALRFNEAGMAALTYDYRFFGTSGGEPRQLLHVPAQIEDCRAAVEYARDRPEIDADRIGIWGTSAGGGYGLEIAATDPRIMCVSAQCASFGTPEEGKAKVRRQGIGWMPRLIVHAQRDKGRGRFGMKPHRIPIVGQHGATALLAEEDALQGYSRIAGPGFVNEICARVMLTPHGKPAFAYAVSVRCPVLIQACEFDSLIDLRSPRLTADSLGEHARLSLFPIGHFEIYWGENFERAVTEQIAFYRSSFGL